MVDKSIVRLHAEITAQMVVALTPPGVAVDVDKSSLIATRIILKSALVVTDLVEQLESIKS